MSKNKRKKIRNIVLGAVAAILLLVMAGAYVTVHHYYSLLRSTPVPASASAAEAIAEPVEAKATPLPEPLAQPEAAAPTMEPNGILHLLLLGVDSRWDSYDSRTDTMMMVSINHEKKEILLTSFLRDTYVYIPDWGYQRLNVANEVGGPAKTIETIAYHYGVEAQNYVFVNFFSFTKAVDIMGGVDIALDDIEVDVINGRTDYYNLQYNSEGVYHLDGTQALAFCRDRSIGSDLRRTQQQRRLIEALWTKAKTLSLKELSDTAETVLAETVTDMDMKTFLKLLALVPQIQNYQVVQQQIPADGTFNFVNIGGASMIDVDFAANREILRQHFE